LFVSLWSVLRVTIFELIAETGLEIHARSHFVPSSVKVWPILRCHVFEVVEISNISLHIFFDYFTALVVYHPLMSCFLEALSFIFVHLLTFNDSIAATNGSVSLGLVNFIAFFVVCLLDELTMSDF
jgi:hypothetical protein